MASTAADCSSGSVLVQLDAHAAPVTLGQHNEPGLVVTAFDDLKGELEFLAGPVDEAAGVAAVGPYQRDLPVAGVEPGQYAAGGVAVGGVGRGDQHYRHQAECVHDDVPLAPVDLLAASKPREAAGTDAAPFTDCESMIAAVGSTWRPSLARTCPRSRSWNSATSPLSRQRR
jgi:hypothetical protein